MYLRSDRTVKQLNYRLLSQTKRTARTELGSNRLAVLLQAAWELALCRWRQETITILGSSSSKSTLLQPKADSSGLGRMGVCAKKATRMVQ